jgi:uncharacterized protein with PIN domain
LNTNSKTTDPDSIRFAADVMVGRLARWLLVLGYDTIYDVNWSSIQLVKKARKENRVLLTRSSRLIDENSDLKSLLIKEDKPWQQLVFIKEVCNLGTDWIFTRCTKCNVKVNTISKEKIQNSVPPDVLKFSEKFYQCPNCDKIFWEGSHYKRFLEFLKKINTLNKTEMV